MKKRLTALLRTGRRPSERLIVMCIIVVCLLLSGFSAWGIVFSSFVQFPPGEAIDLEMVMNLGGIVSSSDLETYLNSNTIADEIVTGMKANLSGNVYDNIEIVEMHDEPLGLTIVKIILDRLFS